MVPHINSTEALSTPGVPSSVHQHMVTLIDSPTKENYLCSVEEPWEYEVIKDGTKLEDCGSVGVKSDNNGGVGPQL